MKRTLFGLVTVILALGLVLAGCSNANLLPDFEGMARKAKTDEIRLDDDQKALAAEVFPFESPRTNASGPKIPSNAHSTDFPGLYFYWADKQKAEECYLLVEVEKFEHYEGFVLTKKVSNTYWDYAIGKAEKENIITANGKDWYLYKIPSGKVYYDWVEEDGESIAVLRDHELKQNGNGSFNINMVFISAWKEFGKEFSKIEDNPIVEEKYVVSFTKEVIDAYGNTIDVNDWDESYQFSFTLTDAKGNVSDPVILTKNSPGAPVVTFEVDKDGSYEIRETIVSGNFENVSGVTSISPSTQLQTIRIISKANKNEVNGSFEVDSKGSWTGGTYDDPETLYTPDIKSFWEEKIRDSSALANAAYTDMLKIFYKDQKPTWIWDRDYSWEWGTTGSEIIHYATEFNVIKENIMTRDDDYKVPIYFACDNVAILFVNEQRVAWTTKALSGDRIVPEYGESFGDLSNEAFDGNAWQQIYFADIYDYLVDGDNTLEFYAANSAYVKGDTQNDKYNITNNPCGLIFACQINVENPLEADDITFINQKKNDYVILPGDNSPDYGSVTATNVGNVPAILAGLAKNGNAIWNGLDKDGNPNPGSTPFVVPNSNHFAYAVLNRDDLADEAVIELDLVIGNNYDILNKAFVKLVGNNLVITIDGENISGGAIAFDRLPVFNNGNIHSQKEADLIKAGAASGYITSFDNGVITIPAPATGDPIYLHLHINGRFFVQD